MKEIVSKSIGPWAKKFTPKRPSHEKTSDPHEMHNFPDTQKLRFYSVRFGHIF